MNPFFDWVRRHKLATGLAVAALVVIGAVALFKPASEKLYLSANDSGVRGEGAMYAMDADMGMAYAEDEAFMATSKQAVAAGMPSPMPPEEPSAGPTAAETTQRLIKTGHLRLVVSSVGESIRAITSYSESVGGYTENSSLSEDYAGREYGNMTVRVPVDKFDAAMKRLRDLAITVKDESVQGQDVTEQYTDLEARLNNARAQEQAYLAILDKAKSVEDILKVQQYLGNVRSQIESYEGRLKYLENRTSLSTINITLEEQVSIEAPTKEFAPLTAAKAAVQALVAALQGIVIGLIWFGITGLGLFLPVLAVVFGFIWVIKRIKRATSKGKKK